MKITIPLVRDSYSSYPTDSLELETFGENNIAIKFSDGGRECAVSRVDLMAALQALTEVSKEKSS